MKQVMLTTTDNPFNPFDDYDQWLAWDHRAGYHTPEYLARLVVSSSELSDVQQQEAIEEAIDEIIQDDVPGLYKKVQREVETS